MFYPGLLPFPPPTRHERQAESEGPQDPKRADKRRY